MGTVTDGAIRDVDEMTNAGFKALARRLCVGHAYVYPIRWNCEVEVFGRTDPPGRFDPRRQARLPGHRPEEQASLLEAARFMDSNECTTVIPAARGAAGSSTEEAMHGLKTPSLSSAPT